MACGGHLEAPHRDCAAWMFIWDSFFFFVKELFEKLFREFTYTTDPVFHYESYMMLKSSSQ